MALQTQVQTFEAERLVGARIAQVLVRAEALVPGADRQGDGSPAGADSPDHAEPRAGYPRSATGHALPGPGRGQSRGRPL